MTEIERTTGNRWGNVETARVLREMLAIREDMIANAASTPRRLDQVHAHHRESAVNLLHYLAMRRRDLRPLQTRLASWGLSSLGRAESHVLATVDAVLDVLHRLSGRPWLPPWPKEGPEDFAHGQRLLAEHTRALLGPSVPGREVRMMVTLPGEAADDQSLIDDLLKEGVECLRINCAHDDSATWLHMIQRVKRAEQSLGRSCRIVMDLAGPKLRTGPIEPGPAVMRLRPRRDVRGLVTNPARLWLTRDHDPQPPPAGADACLSLPSAWVASLEAGETITLTDARGSRRTVTVVDVAGGGCWVEASKTTYLVPETVLCREGGHATRQAREVTIGTLPSRENTIPLHVGDLLVLTRTLTPGRPATFDARGRVLTPARIGCTIPEVFGDVRPGETIWFDDGKIGGVVERPEADQMLIRITQARRRGNKLRADKGINLPDSDLRLPALTEQDLTDLSFVAEHADIVELSFANRAADVEALQDQLARFGARCPAIVLKIETRRGFDALPDMLLTAMRMPCCGVMIARGDLAVECGFERLAEVQEEILWICEAGHVPVIWATQVLENLAKEGMPSRAEITDVAMGHRAECVMLNKGPHVLSAVRVLDDILRRMQAHQAKKRAMLRELRLAYSLETERQSNGPADARS